MEEDEAVEEVADESEGHAGFRQKPSGDRGFGSTEEDYDDEDEAFEPEQSSRASHKAGTPYGDGDFEEDYDDETYAKESLSNSVQGGSVESRRAERAPAMHREQAASPPTHKPAGSDSLPGQPIKWLQQQAAHDVPDEVDRVQMPTAADHPKAEATTYPQVEEGYSWDEAADEGEVNSIRKKLDAANVARSRLSDDNDGVESYKDEFDSVHEHTSDAVSTQNNESYAASHPGHGPPATEGVHGSGACVEEVFSASSTEKMGQKGRRDDVNKQNVTIEEEREQQQDSPRWPQASSHTSREGLQTTSVYTDDDIEEEPPRANEARPRTEHVPKENATASEVVLARSASGGRVRPKSAWTSKIPDPSRADNRSIVVDGGRNSVHSDSTVPLRTPILNVAPPLPPTPKVRSPIPSIREPSHKVRIVDDVHNQVYAPLPQRSEHVSGTIFSQEPHPAPVNAFELWKSRGATRRRPTTAPAAFPRRPSDIRLVAAAPCDMCRAPCRIGLRHPMSKGAMDRLQVLTVNAHEMIESAVAEKKANYWRRVHSALREAERSYKDTLQDVKRTVKSSTKRPTSAPFLALQQRKLAATTLSSKRRDSRTAMLMTTVACELDDEVEVQQEEEQKVLEDRAAQREICLTALAKQRHARERRRILEHACQEDREFDAVKDRVLECLHTRRHQAEGCVIRTDRFTEPAPGVSDSMVVLSLQHRADALLSASTFVEEAVDALERKRMRPVSPSKDISRLRRPRSAPASTTLRMTRAAATSTAKKKPSSRIKCSHCRRTCMEPCRIPGSNPTFTRQYSHLCFCSYECIRVWARRHLPVAHRKARIIGRLDKFIDPIKAPRAE